MSGRCHVSPRVALGRAGGAVDDTVCLVCTAWLSPPCRSGAFQVLAVDGVRTGVLQFHTARESADWLRAVSATISDLTLESVSTRPVT